MRTFRIKATTANCVQCGKPAAIEFETDQKPISLCNDCFQAGLQQTLQQQKKNE